LRVKATRHPFAASGAVAVAEDSVWVSLAGLETGTLGASKTAAEQEEITPETAAALDHARAPLAGAEGIPREDVLREFGLKH
jgi:hypothetical protein